MEINRNVNDSTAEGNEDSETEEVTTPKLRWKLDRKNYEVKAKVLDKVEKLIDEEDLLKNPVMVVAITGLIEVCKSR
ncbi:MAG: hypothetical protein ACLTXM_11960 [Enterococcus sp.]